MESLKKIEEICQPDIRQTSFVLFDPNSPDCARSLTLEDFHHSANGIQLHEGVPEKIRDQFQTARNLIIYSWFYYPFNVTAELCAYATVEHALRLRAGEAARRIPFRQLLETAVKENWIRDEGFSHVKRKHESFRTYNESLPPEWQHDQTPLAQEYCKTISETLPSLRNCLAHGEAYLHQNGAMSVRICAELINQLFERPKAVGSE